MWKVAIVESERGWGQRIDEVKDYEAAKRFQLEFNMQTIKIMFPIGSWLHATPCLISE